MKKVRWRLVAPTALLGLVMFGAPLVWFGPSLLSLLSADVHAVPGEFSVDLEADVEYALGLRTRQERGNRNLSISESWTGDLVEFDVVGPDGESLQISMLNAGSLSFGRPGSSYRAAAIFVPNRSGSHLVTVTTEPATAALVTRSPTTGSFFVVVLAGLIGGLLLTLAGSLWLYDFLRGRDESPPESFPLSSSPLQPSHAP